MEEKANEATIIKRRKIIIVLSIVVYIVIAVTIFIATQLNQDSMIINRSSEKVKRLSSDDMKRIEYEVSRTLRSNYSMSEDEIKKTQITIRESSLVFEEKGEKTVARFLIDLSNPEVSYMGQLTLGEKNEEIYLGCPELSLAKNPKVFCVGYDRQSTIDAMLAKYLPYRGVTEKGMNFSLWKGLKDEQEPRLEAYASLCGNAERKADLDAALDAWLKDKGVEPGVIPLYYDINYCDHGSDDKD